VGSDLASPPRWRTVAASVAGTSHGVADEPCGDSCAVREIPFAHGRSLLVAVAADGAGSAERGREGARIACETVVELADAWAGAAASDEESTRSRALVSFLECPAVNQRTEDDKTLVLATRLGPGPGSDPRPEG
jgi:Protein phosphatase 2C